MAIWLVARIVVGVVVLQMSTAGRTSATRMDYSTYAARKGEPTKAEADVAGDADDYALDEQLPSESRSSGETTSGARSQRPSESRIPGARTSGARSQRPSESRTSGARKSGARSSGARSSGSRKSGARSSGTRSSGKRYSGARNSGKRSSGARKRKRDPFKTSAEMAEPRVKWTSTCSRENWTKQEETLYWAGWSAARAKSPDAYHQGWRDRIERSPADIGKSFPAAVMDSSFHEFSIQCSQHSMSRLQTDNTGNATRVTAATVALGLGYRCLSLDVWMGSRVGSMRRAMSRRFKSLIRRDGGGAATVEKFLTAIVHWCEEDEINNPAKTDSPKMPIVVSVHNTATGRRGSDLSAASIKRVLQDRLVKPGQFAPGTAMSTVAATVGKRRIIFGSGAASSFDQTSEVVAIKESGQGTYITDAVKVDCTYTSDLQVTRIKGLRSQQALVRTQHCDDNYYTQNYPPGKALAAGAQMVCMHFTGLCRQGDQDAACPIPVRGKPEGGICSCDRGYAASLEAAFLRWGYDGYIHYNSLGGSALRELKHLRRVNPVIRVETTR